MRYWLQELPERKLAAMGRELFAGRKFIRETKTMTTDPVCGMKIDENSDAQFEIAVWWKEVQLLLAGLQNEIRSAAGAVCSIGRVSETKS